jgi:hypothetical protein
VPGIVVITVFAALARAPQPVPAALSDPWTADEPLSLAVVLVAAAAVWRRGLLRLTISDVHAAFPDTCAYAPQIDAYRRAIADCAYWYPYRNRGQFSLTVIV